MAEKAWYAISQESPTRWKVTKFKADFTFDREYQVGESEGHLFCSCFAGNKETCRHRRMIPIFQQQAAIGTGWMYQFDTNQWMEPINPEAA